MLCSPGASSAGRAYSSSLVSAASARSWSCTGSCSATDCSSAGSCAGSTAPSRAGPSAGSCSGSTAGSGCGVRAGSWVGSTSLSSGWVMAASWGRCGAALTAGSSAESLDDRAVEGVQVVGAAGGDQGEALGVVDYHLLVGPVAAGVDQVGADRGHGGQLLAVDQAGLDQRPGGVADRGHRLAGGGEGAQQALDGLVGAQVVPVQGAAGQHHDVEVRGIDQVVGDVHGDLGSQLTVQLEGLRSEERRVGKEGSTRFTAY